jgi:hypothetical protein
MVNCCCVVFLTRIKIKPSRSCSEQLDTVLHPECPFLLCCVALCVMSPYM